MMTKIINCSVAIYFSLIVLINCANEENECGGGKDKLVEATKARPIKDCVYNKIIEIIQLGQLPKIKHRYTKEEKLVYDLMKKNKFKTATLFDPYLKTKSTRIVIENNVIVPRVSEVGAIVNYYYQLFKGEGANKLHCRIREHYSGISRRFIQQWLNNNREHCKLNPLFTNKAPLKPVVSSTVQSHHQIDLACIEKYPSETDGEVFSYILSVLDVFSRYLQLRPLKKKEPMEIMTHLKHIYR